MKIDEGLTEFQKWLGSKGDHPNIVLTLRWIAEFKDYSVEQQTLFTGLKDWLRSNRKHPHVLATMRVVREFEKTVEVDARLQQFKEWFSSKDSGLAVKLALWWIAEFEAIESKPSCIDVRN